MIENLKSWSGLVALVILAIMGLGNYVGHSGKFGAAVDCSGVTCFTTVGILTSLQNDGTFYQTGSTTISGAISITGILTANTLSSGVLTTTGDATINGGTLTVTTTNSATSTATAGCIQTYATSTATPIRLIIGNANAAASSTFATGSVGFVNWGFGACPNL